MRINKPFFWDTKISFLAILFLPLSFLVQLIIFFKKKLSRAKKFKLSVICVGNIYIGGTGKTPLSILIANALSFKGKKTAIIRKYYKNHSDEHEMIKNYFNNLILSKSRLSGIKKAEEEGYNTVILDDGFQDYTIKKNLNILCFNQKQKVGNGMVFPSGPLRENFESIKNAKIILINGVKDEEFEKKIYNENKNVSIFYSKYIPVNLDEFKGKELIAIAGIANPSNFFSLLKENNLNIKKELVYPDHYEFSKNEISNIITEASKENKFLIMTEKDFFRIKKFNFKNIRYLKVRLEIDNYDLFINKILQTYDKSF